MPTEVFAPEVLQAVRDARAAASRQVTKVVQVNGTPRTIPYPFPSPTDWRDCWIYFLMVDRFNNSSVPPQAAWNRPCNFRQDGTFRGITDQLEYLATLGVRALWLSPILKNSKPNWEYNYHGYGAQDFLNVDERFASDGTRATAERELLQLVEQAHARGIHVILDMVINHTARVFDYVRNGQTVASFGDQAVMNAPLGQEPPIQWLNGLGFPRADWQNIIPPGTHLSPDDAVYPIDLQNFLFFRRRGNKLSDAAPPGSFARGDFGDMRQFVVEYDAKPAGQETIRDKYGDRPVLSILICAYQYLIAKYDLDGFRIDTVKYVDPTCVEIFGNAIREFAQSIGKRNFFTFGEIYDDEDTIANFVGRNASDIESYGIDAALDFPLFFKLPKVAKMLGNEGVETIRKLFEFRKSKQSELLSTHGEAGRFFVSFLDNHDQHERFNHPLAPADQVLLGYALLFFLQGIPAIYYGTEQGLNGTVDANGHSALTSNESAREALWGKPNPFNTNEAMFQAVKTISEVRATEAALRFGRLYFREVSGNGQDFGHSSGTGGVVAFSRILSDREVTIVANTHTTSRFAGFVLQDFSLNRPPRSVRVIYSNKGTQGAGTVATVRGANFYNDNQHTGTGDAATLFVILAPMEIQVIAPA